MPALDSRNVSVLTLEVIDIKEAKQLVDDVCSYFLARLPHPEQLTVENRRAIVARYTAVLEGNFIYWMTGAYLSAKTEQARSIILDNLREEIGDCHPGMMRRFALAAEAVPNDADAAVVYQDLSAVRLFVGRMQSVPMVLMMAFFEGLLQKFMPYLADLAARQGSEDMEYTDVHGVCDIAHTEGLFRALEAEATLSPLNPGADPYEGVNLLRQLLETVVHGTEHSVSSAVAN